MLKIIKWCLKTKELRMMNIDICSCISNSENFTIPSSEKGNVFVSKCTIPSSKSTVVIIPPYGRTVHDSFLITANLLINDFDVVRFDCRNHVGMSTGDIENYKISTIEMDLMDILKANIVDNIKPIILVGISLSAPVSWKVASKLLNISGVVTLVGVVDMVSTIEKAGEFSLVPYFDPTQEADYYQDVLGFSIITQPFVDDLVEHRYSTLADIKNDVSMLSCPLYMISAADDSWISLDQVKQVIDIAKNAKALCILENSDHELGKSAVIAKKAATFIVDFCKKIVGDSTETVVPELTQLIKASALESEKFSQLEPKELSEKALLLNSKIGQNRVRENC